MNPYPPIEPWDHGWLDVGDGHAIHYEQCGNPAGTPIIVLHGGPGSGCSAMLRRLLDPARFRMALFDQRGCGRSTPLGALNHNHTEALVADIERLRQHLGLGPCLASGGSWGAALALAWAGRHREHCRGLLLRAPFLTGDEDLNWFFDRARSLLPCPALARLAAANGTQHLFPCLPRALLDAATPDDARPLMSAWMQWEQTLGSCGRVAARIPAADDHAAWSAAWHKYRVQAHYLLNHCFIGEQALLDIAASLRGIPVCLIHGRADLVCRPRNSRLLQQGLPDSRLLMVDGVGHDPFAPAMLAALREAVLLLQAKGD